MRRAGRTSVRAAVGMAAVAGLLVTSPGTAGAETTATQAVTIDLGDLDLSGAGTFEGFDSSLGQLTAVDVTVDVTMDFSVCLHNESAEATSVPAGSAGGTAPVVFPADVVAHATGSMAVPVADLSATDGGDDCDAWLGSGIGDGPAPSSDDSILITETDTSNFAETVTDPADLASFIDADVPFSFTASSASDLAQPSEWTIIFLAQGSGELTIRYTYVPGAVQPTVIVPTAPGDPVAPVECVPAGSQPPVEFGDGTMPVDCPEGEVLGRVVQRSELPRTGRGLDLSAIAGGLLVSAGVALTLMGRRFQKAA